MSDYTHLGMRERCLISTFLSMNVKISEIAERMGRHRSTIYRELRRNIKGSRYMPGLADALARERHPCPPNKLQKSTELNKNKYVCLHLVRGWSPEQIAGRMKLESKPFYICTESIYRFIYRHKNLGLYKFLPRWQSKIPDDWTQ